MKIGTCRFEGREALFVVVGDRAAIPSRVSDRRQWSSVPALIRSGEEGLRALREWSAAPVDHALVPLHEVRLMAPIPRPRKNIVCLGWNYTAHIHESSAASGRGAELPEHPVVFTKAVTSVIGPGDPVPVDPAVSNQMDWETELGVVIGRSGRAIAVESAMDHVFGYTIINDVSARDLQFRHKQFFLGKSLDGSCPIGPWIVTADELTDPQGLDLHCRVNGVLKQDANTRQMIFPLAEIVSILSRGMTLEAGDLIATGTPEGVGFARNPPEYLRPGDTVRCDIEGIGFLENPVRAR